MSDKFFTSNFNAKEVTKFLQQQADKLGDLTPLMKVARKKLRDIVMKNFETEGTASGEKWKAWSEAYKKARLKMGKGSGKILTLSGELRRSIKAKSGKDYAQVGTASVYAAMHNFGYDDYIKRRTKNGTTKYKLKMPKREFIRISQAQQEDLLSDLIIEAEDILMNQEALKRAYGK